MLKIGQTIEIAEYVKAKNLKIFQHLVQLSKVVSRTGLTASDQTWQELEAIATAKVVQIESNEMQILAG